jgi:type IV pilus assembly protein PilM
VLALDEIEESELTGLCCPECEVTNPPQRKFCSKCGTPLWEPCFQCGDLCAVGETYCGACGANLPELAAEQVEITRNDLCTAIEMQSAFRFEEAADLLSRISKKEHPRLAEYAARAKELIRQLVIERQRQRTAANEAYQRARQCLADCDYDGAAGIIENVPLPLQNDDVRQLRTQIAERRREIEMLTEELQNAVRHKRLLELPSRIERLLILKPDHAYAKNLAVQVQKRLVAAAKKMLGEHRYDQALRLLDQTSVQADAVEFQQVRRQAAELSWLAWDLRNAPVVDDTLAAVAERLRRLSPKDAQSIRLCNELQHRSRLAKSEQRRQPLQWAQPPEQTPLGVAVEWLTGFRRIACSETMDRSELERHPGRFYIACGLALAGIKQAAALGINLLSAKQRGMLRRMTHAMRSRNTGSAWGIDLGTSGLKAVKLIWNETKQQAVIEAVTFIEHSKMLSYAANEAEEEKLVAETLQKFLDVQETKGDRLCVGLPGRMTLSRQITVPSLDSAKTAKLVQFEAVHQFPFPLEQLAWDFQLLDDAGDPNCEAETSGEKGRRVLLIAAKRTTTEHFLDAFQRLDMRVDVLQTDFVALHNFLAYDYFDPSPSGPPSGEACPVVAALDIGYDVTNIIVSSPRSLWFRRCGVAGHSFTRALVKEFKLSIAQAEQRKRAPESAERLSDLCEVLSPVFDDLLKEIRQSLDMYAESPSARPIQRVLGLGGEFLLHGLFRHLRCGR